MTGRPDSASPMVSPPATLENCADEPIHIPGAIQPHGALFAFDADRRLTHVSANAGALLGLHPALGETLTDAHFAHSPAVRTALQECFGEAAQDGVAPASCHVTVNGIAFDLVIHASKDCVVAEFERRDMSADNVSVYALMAHRAMLKLKRQRTEGELLNLAVAEVRKLTGFDRVMAYRFRHDDSGDVVAKSLVDGLEPYLGRRYPASDIPAQARRLYVISTLRIISDVSYQAVPLLQLPDAKPLDMSWSTLRSVSPIHIEYLTNIGVGASMSVSIVVNGRLWGMLACHHMSPRYVPYSIRMACDVLAQLLASAVQELAARRDGARIASSAELHTRLLEEALHARDLVASMAPHLATVRAVLEADAVFATVDGLSAWDHDLDLDQGAGAMAELARRIAGALPVRGPGDANADQQVLAYAAAALMPPAMREAVEGRWCGLLAMRFDPTKAGWLVALRAEQIETVRWGGRPDKEYRIGPSGPRLTPRGSFDEWRETVRGTALPWTDAELHIARDLGSGLLRATSARMADAERSRNQFLAILGHDLRGPLHAINMAAQVLQRGKVSARMVNTIVSSSTRMQRLVEEMLDVSRLQNGLGLGLRLETTELVALIDELVDENLIAQPDKPITRRLPDSLLADVDRDRIFQMLGNIVSNALRHAEANVPVEVSLRAEDGMAVIEIRNAGAPIDPDLLPAMFDPFKRSPDHYERHRTGMGLGLYIAHEIAAGHGGSIRYAYRAPFVVFEARVSLRAPEAPGES